MKNNKGFTLVELMAVIVILAILVTIAVPSAISISNKIKKKMYNTKVEMIYSAAKMYGQDNLGKFENITEGNCNSITVQDLIEGGYVKKDSETDVQDPRDKSPLNERRICLEYKNSRVYVNAETEDTTLRKEE